MVDDDVQLIRRILLGDNEAFSALVQKHQKGVHALVWRKVGDYHFAEEVTQDVFLQVYKNLPKLKDPSQFAGWLYVITDRLCIRWFRRNKARMQSLEATPLEEVDRSSYTHYVVEQRETQTTEHHHEIVKKLLAKLPESERTVMTLYYLGEMTSQEISKFLGVSVNTITSRLQRGRKRLRKEEALLVQQGVVQLPPNLTDNIMQQIADVKPIPPPVGKPILPWAAFGAAATLILLLLGASDQYLVRFQKPYSFEAASEPTIEIVDTAVILDIDSKPDMRNQSGRAGSTGKDSDAGLQDSEAILSSDVEGDSLIPSTPRRIRAIGPEGGHVFDIFETSRGTLYAATQTGIHRLAIDAIGWTLVNTNIPTPGNQISMAEHGGTLYIVSTDEIFASDNDGKTWNIFCPRPEGDPVGLIITDEAQDPNLQTSITMYLAFRDKGVFRATDASGQWELINKGLIGKHIYKVSAVGNIVFVGTNEGLYRLNTDLWEQVEGDVFKAK